jgi:hypothetical protein
VVRHRRPLNIRDDGLPAVIGPLVTVGGVDMAVLLEVDSGMVLDAWVRGGLGDAEALGAGHADVVRALLAVAGPPVRELVLSEGCHRHHLVRCVTDPSGGRLALAVVVAGSSRIVRRTRRRLRALPDVCLTTGPWIPSSGLGGPPPPAQGTRAEWAPTITTIDTGVIHRVRTAGVTAPVPAPRRGPAPPSALPPARRGGDGWPP